jgi:hypothetical protein
MGFNLNEYETVEERLAKFIADFPDFRISTELESMADNRFVIKAYIYRTFADAVAFSTGYAEEKVSDRGVNATSALENCETSAIGRALANAGYAAKGKRPSREEMAKVNNTKPIAAAIKGGEERLDMWGDAVGIVAQGLNAEVVESVPACKHGSMTPKEGTGKTGKPYRGYVCTAPKASQCKPMWMNLTAQGTWVLQDIMES